MKITKMSKTEKQTDDKIPGIEISVRSKVKVPKDLIDFLAKIFIKFHGEDVYNIVIQHQNWHLISLSPKAIMIEPIILKHCHGRYSVIVTYNKSGLCAVATGKMECVTFNKREMNNYVLRDLEHLLWYANKKFNNNN